MKRRGASIQGIFVATMILAGCNAILGTEDPILDAPDGGAASSASTASTTTSSVGGGSTTSTTSSAGGNGAGGMGGATTSTSSAGGGGAGGSPCDTTTSPEWAHWSPAAANSYTTTSDTATDAKTGLVWQRVVASTYTFDDAVAYCDALSLDGFDDFRLPTRIEMPSIVDFTTSNPAIDAVAFPGTPPANFWLSSPFVPDATKGLHARREQRRRRARSEVRHERGAVRAMRTSKRRLSSAFAGVALALLAPASHVEATPHCHYAINAGTVLDTETGLTWQQVSNGTLYDAIGAASYRSSLGLAGGGWRLPTIAELHTIVDVAVTSPTIDVDAFPSTQTSGYFTSTLAADGSGKTWVVSFSDGTASEASAALTFYARCVK